MQFAGSIPEQYDTLLGPFLFEFSAKDLAERISNNVTSGELLEIACGTGISTEYMRKSLPEGVSIIATDISDGMLDVAREKRGNLANVTYQVANGLDLPFEDGRFDAVACQFGVMFYPDRAKGFSEMVRVVKEGGHIIFNVWDSLEHNPAIKIAADVIESCFDDNPPQFLKVPFGFYDVAEITALMEGAGMKDVKSHVVTNQSSGVSIADVARGAVEGNPTIIEVRERASVDSETMVEKVREALEKEYGSEDPHIPLQEIVFEAVK